MAQSFVQVPPDSTGKLVDTFATGGTGHQRQAVIIADPDTDGNVVPIGADGALPIKTETQLDYATSTTSTSALSVIGLALASTSGPVGVGSGNPLPVTGTLIATLSSTTFKIGTPVTIANTTFNLGSTTFNVGLPVSSTVTGNVADDGVASGNPVRIGLLAKSPDGTDPGNVSAEDDVAAGIADLNRRIYVNTVHPATQNYHQDTTSTISTVAIASPGAGLQVVISNLIFSSGTTSGPNLTVKQATTTGTTMIGPIYLESTIGRGFASGPIYKAFPASTAVALLTSSAGAQSVDIDYFIQKV